jgi:hypothetical protein
MNNVLFFSHSYYWTLNTKGRCIIQHAPSHTKSHFVSVIYSLYSLHLPKLLTSCFCVYYLPFLACMEFPNDLVVDFIF